VPLLRACSAVAGPRLRSGARRIRAPCVVVTASKRKPRNGRGKCIESSNQERFPITGACGQNEALRVGPPRGCRTVASRAHRTVVSRLFGTKLRASHSLRIFGVGIPDIGSTDSDAGRLKGATADLSAARRSHQISPLNKESGPCRCCSGYQ
jgi:hypothetical protein